MNHTPLKILITTQVFPPEVHPTGVIAKELASDLARVGHHVTVAAGFPNHPYGQIYPGHKKRLLAIEKHNGFRLVRGWHLIHPSNRLIPQLLVMASQCCAHGLVSLFTPRSDIVISHGVPLLGPLNSAFIARSQGAKLISVIYDFQIDVAVEIGLIKNKWVIRCARKLESLIYQWSDLILVLSEGFRRTLIYEKGVDPEKIAVIPVWLNAQDVVPKERINPWRQEMEIPPDKFIVLYSGTIGLVSGAEVVVEASQRLASHPDILFLMVGAGQARDQVEIKAREAGITNIRFFPFQPRERLSELQASADVSLVTLAPGRGKTSVPSKVLGYMAAARPVIASVDLECDTAELIQKVGCGQVVPPALGKELAEAILHYYHNPQERKAAGEKGRQYFLENLEHRVILNNYINLIENLASAN